MAYTVTALLLLLHLFGLEAIPYFNKDFASLLFQEKIFEAETIKAILKHANADSSVYIAQRGARSPGLECKDKLGERSCHYLRGLGFCSTRRDSMELHCKRSCKLCVDPPCHLSRYGCCFDNKTIARGPHMMGCEDDCKDRREKSFCRTIRRNGECYKDSEDVKRQCPVTCGYCRPCEDDDPETCKMAVMFEGCSRSSGEMANICRKTCNFCGKNDPCIQFMCPKGSVCQVGKNMKPFCKCDGNCKQGDYYTGVACGRDGIEYKNLCELKQRNCGHPEIDQITIKNYGKCQQNVAPSDKRLLCSKSTKESGMCRVWASRRYCTTRRSAMIKLCPKTCNFCAAQFAKPSCHYTKFGCCLDNKTKCLDTDYKGCPKFPACRDFSKTFCKRFTPLCGAENFHARMARYCGLTCNYCSK